MPDALALAFASATACVVAAVVTPVAMRLALRTGFLDRPVDYKGHARPTPYLGGAAVMAAFLPVALAYGGTDSGVAWILAGAVVLWLVGTIDDRRMLGPLPRLAVEAGVATWLWAAGLGWSVFNSDVASLAVTIVWIVGIVNAFNLMDNLDGATGTVGAMAATGIAAACLADNAAAFAIVAVALGGACAGFLVHNLRRPARIFLGDGGSMPIGFVLAATVMAVAHDVGGLGAAALVAAAPLVGLPVFDTTLVMISRSRRGVPLFTGGRDHLTHRILRQVGTPQRVAVVLAGGQALLCTFGVLLLGLSATAVVAAGIVYVVLGSLAIAVLELTPALHPEWFPRADPEPRIAVATAPAGQESRP